MIDSFLNLFFHQDPFRQLIIGLVLFIGLCVCRFAYQYMKGDLRYTSFFIEIILLILSISIMVTTDNLIVFFVTWCLNNATLVKLMIHKSSWNAAKYSGIIASKNYFLGTISLSIAFLIVYKLSGTISIDKIITYKNQDDSPFLFVALILIITSAMTQSAIWPFHRWLINSLNSPTPVSAIMHAGLINAGGFLLIRFSPLYLQQPALLNVIFLFGFISMILGTLWKLIQSDIKRMLACSTMAQMGFMFVQCGIGLFAAAIAHLIWHGIFKAYLFLASGGVIQEKRFDLKYPANKFSFICALICGFIGSIVFGYITEKSWFTGDSSLVLMTVALITITQFSITFLRVKPIPKLPIALVISSTLGALYGLNVQLVAYLLEPLNLNESQPLNTFHIIAILILMITWLFMLFFRHFTIFEKRGKNIFLKTYVSSLNASQPLSSTITAHRNEYEYR